MGNRQLDNHTIIEIKNDTKYITFNTHVTFTRCRH